MKKVQQFKRMELGYYQIYVGENHIHLIKILLNVSHYLKQILNLKIVRMMLKKSACGLYLGCVVRKV